jgi:adenosylmethionine-8-amino-7-oxononanoate aminotransferase
VGASTGGFTDCLLQRGAAAVVALDVAYGVLHWRLRQDPRVTVLERRNVRSLSPEELPFAPDVIATAKGLGAGYAAIGATICRRHIYEAIADGSRRFPLGHTWNGAPLSCAVGLAVIDILRREGLVERVRERGPRLRGELEEALADVPIVRDVRGHGFLLGIDYVDPRDGRSFLPPELGVAGRIDTLALEQGLVLLSTQPTRDGYAGDQTLFAPAFTATDEELGEMVERYASVVREVAAAAERELERVAAATGVAR